MVSLFTTCINAQPSTSYIDGMFRETVYCKKKFARHEILYMNYYNGISYIVA